ncbi:MAG: M12 family metallo-peptidase [Steroidobacteraceae bacterium]
MTSGGKVFGWGIALAFAFVAPWAQAREPARILYLEPARALQARHVQGTPREELSFEAFGKRFDLQLETNPRLAAAIPATRPDLAVLEGRIAGLPGSWARLTRTRRGLSGLIADGREIYAVEPAGEIAALADAALTPPSAGTVVYRLADALVDPQAVSCGVVADGKPTSALALYKALGAELAPLAATVADRQLDVAAVADYELYQAHGAATIDFLLARLNAVDGIFAAQVGIRIHVGTAFVYTTDQDPFTATAAPDLLQQLAGYRRTTIASQRLGLTHLMTGRELDDTTVGIAYLDTVCSLQSASLTEARPGKLSAALVSLVAAHEIGHNFGAPHDGEAGKACAATNPNAFLMAPTLSTANSQFSQCSLGEIARRVAAAQCLTAVDQVDVEIVAPVAVARHGIGVNYSLTFNVRSLGTRDAASTLARFAIPAGSTLEAVNAAGGTCTVSGSQASCSLGTLPSGAARTLTLSLTGNVIGTETLFADVMAFDDGAPANDTASVEIATAPLADLATSVSVAPASLATGAEARYTVTVANKGPSVTSDARLSIDVPTGLAVTAVDAGGLACTVSANSIACDPQLIAVGDTRTVRLTVRADASGAFTVTAVALTAAIDPEGANNAASALLTVTAPPGGGPVTPPPPPPPTSDASSGGGGGGSFPAMLLVALALALAARAAQPMTTSRSFASTARPGRASTSAT